MATVRLNSTSSAQDGIRFHHKSIGSSAAVINGCKGTLMEFQLAWGPMYNILQATATTKQLSYHSNINETVISIM